MRTCFSTCRSTRPDTFASFSRSPSADGAQRIEVVAEDFERDLGAHARQHVVEPVRDRLADIERDRQHGKALAEVGDDRALLRARGFEVDVDLGGMHAFGVLIELGTAGAPADRFHLRHVENEPLGDQADPVGFGERDAGIEQRVDGEGALVEGRQEGARQQECGNRRDDDCKPTAVISSGAWCERRL